MEIEMRFKTKEDTKNNLEKIGAKHITTVKQDDTYYKFSLDKERRIVIRIRRDHEGKEKLTFKGSSKDKEDIAWQEWEHNIQKADVLNNLFLSNGLEIVCRINKKRDTYKKDGLEINLDEIDGLGTFVEVEVQTENIELGKQKILEFIRDKLEIDESDIITKGYVPLMIEKNEKSNKTCS